MAAPAGHYLVGLSIAQGMTRDEAEGRRALWLRVVAMLPGLLVGNIGRFHHDISHSLLAATVFSIAASLLLIRLKSERALFYFIAYFLVYASHPALDTITIDAGAPFGIPLFWPIIAQTFRSPWLILPNVRRNSASLFRVHNVHLIIREVLIFLPLVGLTRTLGGSWSASRKRVGWLYGSCFLIAAVISAISVR